MALDPYIGAKLVASKHREMLAAAANDRLVGHGPVWTWAAHAASALLRKASTLTAQYDLRSTHQGAPPCGASRT
jgi:tRNA(Arg) A34 adenosine deaminase TadA